MTHTEIRSAFLRGQSRADLAAAANLTRGQINRIVAGLGRPRYMPGPRRGAAIRMYRAGASLADVAVRYGVWRSTVSRWVHAAALR